MTPSRLLIVDDDGCIRSLLERILKAQGLAIRLAASGEEAVALYRRHGADLVLLDVHMPGMDGPETLAALRQLNPNLRCYFMTGDTGRYDPLQLIAQGATDIIQKPFNIPGVVQLLRQALAAGPALQSG